MMKRFIFSAISILLLFFCTNAQENIKKRKIAIYAPLYLDSAFDYKDEYRFSKNVFPKFINPGLEFYEGAQLALDSLNKEGAPLEVFIFDTKSSKESLAQQLNSPDMDGVEMIIVNCSSSEVRIFADAGLRKNIPVINANLPNDGGAAANPFFLLLNPTLKTQCEGIYKHLQKHYSLDPIIVLRKKGPLEDRIKNYFDEFGKSTAGVPLKMKYVEITDSSTINHLKSNLDTSNQTICIVGSLDENFGKKMTQQLASLNKQNYPATVIGMPTWDGISFNKPEFKGIDIIYSTPFYHAKTDWLSQSINRQFNKTMFARPSDMVYRGYEITYRFAKMLLQYGNEISSNLANDFAKVFIDFDIKPVLNRQNMTLDYFENKKLYFLKWQDGGLKGVY